MSRTRRELLQIVQRSPACVAAHDRAGWLALFARDAVVEDPVGAAPTPRAALGRFWDTFIADNEIAFAVTEDLTAGDEVVRDVDIHTRLSTGLRIEVPAHLFYEVVDEDGLPRLRRMRAVWDLRERTLGALKAGPRGWWTLCAVFGLMLRVQGLGGVLGYARGLVCGVFARGRATVQRFAAAVTAGDARSLAALFQPGARLEFPVGTARSAAEWLALLGPGAALRTAKVIAAGHVTAFRFRVEGGALSGAAGVALLEFDPQTGAIAGARCFMQG